MIEIQSKVINFMSPPIPFFIGCGTEKYRIGDKHINRFRSGVFDIICVVTGTLHIGEANNNWSVQENEVIILRPDVFHCGVAECTEETTIHWVHFNTVGVWGEHDSMQSYLKFLPELKAQHTMMPSQFIHPISIPKYFKLTERAISFIKELIALQKEPRSIAAWKQQTVFQLFLQEIDCERTVSNDISALQVVEKVKKFIHKNYKSQITNERLLKELNFHPNYLSRCMRKVYGITPLEYLVKYRISIAKKLLLNTDLSIEKIAEEVGLEHSTFSNSFKAREGVSPRNYRKKYFTLSNITN